MEIAIIAPIVIGMYLLAKKGKKARELEATNKQSKEAQDRAEAERKRKLKEADEIITVILPTIRNGK